MDKYNINDTDNTNGWKIEFNDEQYINDGTNPLYNPNSNNTNMNNRMIENDNH